MVFVSLSILTSGSPVFLFVLARFQTNGHAQTPTEENGTSDAVAEEKLNGNAEEHEVRIITLHTSNIFLFTAYFFWSSLIVSCFSRQIEMILTILIKIIYYSSFVIDELNQ